jgi:hypothetical protein
LKNTHHALRVFDRQRPESDGIEQRENTGIYADAQRERQQRSHGETAVFEQSSKRIAQILERTIEHSGLLALCN